MLKRLIGSILIGIICLLYLAPYDPWVTARIGNMVKDIFQESFDCRLSYSSCAVSFFPFRIVLTDMHVTSNTGLRWSWHVNAYTMNCSWRHLLATGMAQVCIKLDGLAIMSDCTGSACAITSHLQKLLSEPAVGVPLVLKELSCARSVCTIKDPAIAREIQMDFSGLLKQINNQPHAIMAVERGQLKDKETVIIDGAGVLRIAVDAAHHNELMATLKGELYLPINSSRYLLNATWYNNKGVGKIETSAGDLTIDPIEVELDAHNNMRLHALLQSSGANLLQLVGISKEQAELFSGKCVVSLAADAQTAQFNAAVYNPMLWKYSLGSAVRIRGSRNDGIIKGTVHIASQEDALFAGIWCVDERVREATLSLHNEQAVAFPFDVCKSIAPHACTVRVQADGIARKLQGHFEIDHNNDVHGKTTGELTASPEGIELSGSYDRDTYLLSVGLQPHIHLCKLIYACQMGKNSIELTRTGNWYNRFTGTINLESMCSLVSYLGGPTLSGTGSIQVQGYTDVERTAVKLSYKEGLISLPGLYNCIHDFQARFVYNSADKQLVCSPFICNFSRGKITCERAVIQGQSGSDLFMHVPLQLKDFWLNNSHTLFLIASAQLLLSKKPARTPLLSGTVILDHVQLSDNIFSGALERGFLQSTRRLFVSPVTDLDCSLIICSKHPIRVTTFFLSTQAQLHLHAGNRLQDPHISGVIELQSGHINFPYKPLFINKGTISFGQALIDPFIDLSASNIIKGYDIQLHAQGLRTHHEMNLSSDPPLSHEQIMALLFAGSPHEPLSALIPAFLMHNLTEQLFNSVDDDVFLSRSVKKLFKPMRRVHFIPHFIDESGRSRLRGTIEIDINDRWRALLQKNFTLAEDTRCEVEYRVSDDISIRAFKDEQRNVGSEVEMRWQW